MDASLAFRFSSHIDSFSVRFFIRRLCPSIKLLRESISLFVTKQSILLFYINDAIKGTLLGLGQFLATESPLKMKKNAFYFTSKAFFVLKILKVLTSLFAYVEKQRD